MGKKMHMGAAAFLMVLFLISSEMATVIHADATDPECYDACNMGCVNRSPRLYSRCDRKCQIRCGPDVVEEKKGLDHRIGG